MSAYGKRCPQADRVRLIRGEDATNAVADGMSPNSLLWPSPTRAFLVGRGRLALHNCGDFWCKNYLASLSFCGRNIEQ